MTCATIKHDVLKKASSQLKRTDGKKLINAIQSQCIMKAGKHGDHCDRPSVAQFVAYIHTAEGLVVAGSEAQLSAQTSVTISRRTTALCNTSLYSGVNDSGLILLAH